MATSFRVSGIANPGASLQSIASVQQQGEPEVKEQVAAACIALTSKMEVEIREALNAFWPVWTLEDVKRRCQIVRCGETETLYADGIPLLEMHPPEQSIERTDVSYIVRVTRKFRRLHNGRDGK